MTHTEPVPYEGQLIDHELYRVTLSDRTKAAGKVNELVSADAFTFEADGTYWSYSAVPGKKARMTKEAFAWIDRYLRTTYGLRYNGPRPRWDE